MSSFHPSSPIEQRGRELDSCIIRRARTAPLHELQRMRASHERLFHAGDACPDGCWLGHLYRRQISKRLGGG